MSLQWNAPLQPDYVITAYTLHHRVPSLKSQSEMWAPPSTATVQFHTYNPSGILFYQINSVMNDFLGLSLDPTVLEPLTMASNTFYVTVDMVHTAAITAAIVPLLTMKVYSSDGFDAVSVQNVGSTYIIVSWDLPIHSPPVTPAGTALQLEHGVGRHQCCSQPAQVVAPGHKEHEEPLAVSIPSHHWYSSLGSKFRSRLGGVTSSQDAA
eukprot:Em0020g298a